MSKLRELKKHLKPGKVYRRSELAKWSRSVDRHIVKLLEDGTVQKIFQGIYYCPKETTFGKVPPEEESLVRSFLKDNRFLITSLNSYNKLGVGTTQLYNKTIVYNHKRKGEFKLGNRIFFFQIKAHFPKKITPEFLLVDLFNNLEILAENHQEILQNISFKISMMDKKKLSNSVSRYGSTKAKATLVQLINN